MTIAAALLTLAVGMLAAGPARAALRPSVVVLGDSLASGHGIGADQAFPAILQQRLDEAGYALEVVNAGVSGDTTEGGARRLDPLLAGDVRVLVVELGANDGLRGVPVDAVRRNLASILDRARARGVPVLLCGMQALPLYGWDYSVQFHRAYLELAQAYDVPLVPFLLVNVLGRRDLMQADHVHPNARGARVMADHVWPYLEALLARADAPRATA